MNLVKKELCVETNTIYNYVVDAENITGIKGIGMVCNGERKTAGGYHWIWVKK